MALPFAMNFPSRGKIFLNVVNAKLRSFSTTIMCKNNVRVRFAPSPTGQLHLGSLRTALYNYSFAKHQQGVFILRIEDTDQTRKVPHAVENIQEVLEWAGLIPDEGPLQGGDHGPYMQSERLPLYESAIQTLLENGSAYRCFCSGKRLALLRKEAHRRQETPKYDQKCRHLTEKEVQQKIEEGQDFVIRLKIDNWKRAWEDLVYGQMEMQYTEGDPVLIKTDKFPTYHFANVVDDHHMKISHVIRGVEWQTSVPKHLALYEAFGWDPPKFAHTPLILNKNGTKLSKRQGDSRVQYFRDNHYDPEVLLNYITLVGGGFQADLKECHDLETLVKTFDLSKIKTGSSRLEPERLQILNRSYLGRVLNTNPQNIINEMRDMVKQKLSDRINEEEQNEILSDEHMLKILKLSHTERMYCLSDLVEPNMEFIWIRPSVKHLEESLKQFSTSDLKIVLTLTMDLVQNSEDLKNINTALRQEAKNQNIKVLTFMKILRKVISMSKDGPSIEEMMGYLQKQEVMHRLNAAMDIVKNTSNDIHIIFLLLIFIGSLFTGKVTWMLSSWRN